MKLVLISLIVFLLITISADIYSESDLYGVPNKETSTTILQSNLSFNESLGDDLYVNIDGDTMTGNLSIDADLRFIGSQIIDVFAPESTGIINFINSGNSGIAYFIFNGYLTYIGNFLGIGDFSVQGDGTFDGDLNVTGVSYLGNLVICTNGTEGQSFISTNYTWAIENGYC